MKMAKKRWLVILLLLLIAAGVLDILFEGLFFQMLPDSIQTNLRDML
ncbi:Uncharacterised protein [Mycobacteroides abscessus subsp. abscessus]|nr:Uncharacterised protein [Mycobacteroides abscessus subsp. abscessus]